MMSLQRPHFCFLDLSDTHASVGAGCGFLGFGRLPAGFSRTQPGGVGGADECLYIGREEGESDDRVYRERIETTMQYSEIEK